jgi:DNA-binding transcriptional regulator YdaS (Cro superfamily)
MTNAKNPVSDTPEKTTSSLQFLADAPELLKVRIHPAEFARLLGVSKQTVSQWIKKGHVSINPLDGRLDVTAAVQQVLRNTDPGRLRARVLRQAVEDVQSLRRTAAEADERVAAVQAQLDDAAGTIRHYKAYADDVDCMLDKALDLLRVREAEFRTSADSAEWAELVRRLEADAAALCDPVDDLAGLPDDPSALDALPDDLPELTDLPEYAAALEAARSASTRPGGGESNSQKGKPHD